MQSSLFTLNQPTKRVGRKALASLAGVRDSTLKYYSEQGLLPYFQGEEGLARRYDPQQAMDRLQEIEDLQSRGLSIEQIKERLEAGQLSQR
jgi:DNA-binding transcriptional MerR regulator